MIEKIYITNFKGFRELEIAPISRITLLGGENSVGKTSVLEAVFMFFDRRNPEMILRQFAWRGLNRAYLSTEQMFSPVFHNYSLGEKIVLVLTVNAVEERLNLTFSERVPEKRVRIERFGRSGSVASKVRTDDKPVVNGSLDIDYTRKGDNAHASLIITADGLKMREERTKFDERPAVYMAPRLPSSPAEDAQRFGELDVKGEVDGAVQFLKQFDPRIKGLTSVFFGDSSVIHADIGLTRKVPLPHLGEGLAHLMSIYLAMSYAKGGVVLLDEIGTGIHHSLLPKFWTGVAKAARKFDCQVLATTHSYETMGAAVEGLSELFGADFTYVRLDRESNAIKPTIYSFEEFSSAMQSGWEVR